MRVMTQTRLLVRIARIAGGGLLIGVGLIGLVLPAMPGWLFIIPGLTLWAAEFAWARKLVDKAKARLRRGLRPNPEKN